MEFLGSIELKLSFCMLTWDVYFATHAWHDEVAPCGAHSMLVWCH